MSVDNYRLWLMAEIKTAKANLRMTYQQISARSRELGDFVSVDTIKAVFRDNGVGHKIATLQAIAAALGIDYTASHTDGKLLTEIEYLKKDVAAKEEQISHMREIMSNQSNDIDTYQKAIKRKNRLLRRLTITLIVLCLLLVCLFATDMLTPSLGFFRGIP